MRPLFPADDYIRDGVFVVYDGPESRFATNKLVNSRMAHRLISNNKGVAPNAKAAFIVRVKENAARKEQRRAERNAIRQRAIEVSKAKQAIRQSLAYDAEPYGA